MSLIARNRMPYIFRFSAGMDRPIKLSILQEALSNIMPRFPYYRVNLKPGFFWNYWDVNMANPRVIADSRYICQKMPLYHKGIFPFRVRAFQNRIACEFHHAITDGTGGLIFLKALVTEYLVLSGVKLSDPGDIFRPGQEPDLEEYEDGSKRYYQKRIPIPDSPIQGFQLPYRLLPPGINQVITGILPLKEALALAKSYGVTLTEFFAAIYIDCLQELIFSYPEKKQRKLMKPIRIFIPVNARNLFPSKTMRNFFVYGSPGIDPRLGRYDFQEILTEVHHQMRGAINKKRMNMQIRRAVRSELNPFIRIVPLPFKKITTRLAFPSLGENQHSGVITNLGPVNFPDELHPYIKDVQFFPASSYVMKTTCAVLSYQDKLYINFLSVIKETNLEKLFFRRLRKMGIPVKIQNGR